MRSVTFICICCLVIVFSFEACAGQPPTPTPTLKPTETEKPPEPTPVPPTATPVPTDTPEPTSTPEPTASPEPTATPVPIDLLITVNDSSGNIVSPAYLQITGVDEKVKPTSDDGRIAWRDLPSEDVNLTVKASGYIPLEKSLTLQRGDNTETVILEDDPLGYKASIACGPDEELLYIEDLQDQTANDWSEVDAGAMGWSVVEVPGEAGNFAIAATGSKDIQPPGTNMRSGLMFDNAVWRIKVMFDGKSMNSTFLNWRHSFDTGDVRYFTNFGPNVLLDMTRFNSGQGIMVGRAGTQAQLKKWYYFEVSFFNGEVQVWLNGKKMIVYKDKSPFPPGTIGLEPHFQNDGVIYFDNMAVCELASPFVSLPLPTPVKKK